MVQALDILTGLRQFIDAYRAYAGPGDPEVNGMEIAYQYVLDRINDSIEEMAGEDA